MQPTPNNGATGGTNGLNGNNGWVRVVCSSYATVCAGGNGQGTGYGTCLASIKWHTASAGAGGSGALYENIINL